MNKQQYRDAYRYIRCERYQSVVDALIDYDFYLPCTGCNSECPNYSECMDALAYQHEIELQVQEWAREEMQRLEAGLTRDEIEIARKHYYAGKESVPDVGVVVRLGNHYSLAYAHYHCSIGDRSHPWFKTVPRPWEHEVTVTRCNWGNYFRMKQEIGVFAPIYQRSIDGFKHAVRERFGR